MGTLVHAKTGYLIACEWIYPDVAKNDELKRIRVRQPGLRGAFSGLRRTHRSPNPEKVSTDADGVLWCERQRFRPLFFATLGVRRRVTEAHPLVCCCAREYRPYTLLMAFEP